MPAVGFCATRFAKKPARAYNTVVAAVVERLKYTDLAKALEADVRTGRWDGGRLPSVRKVAVTYHVSVVTASRALQVLRDKGLVHTIERSGCYRVAAPHAERWAVVLRLTQGPMIGLTTSLVREGFEAIARYEPMHLHFDSFDVKDGLTVAEAESAAATAKANGVRGVVYLPARSSPPAIAADVNFLAGCRRAGLPVCLFERSLAGSHGMAGCDLVAIDDLGATQQAIQHLIKTGCHSIACVTASDVSSHRDRVAGYLAAFFLGHMKGKPAVLVQEPAITPGEAYVNLATSIIKAKYDAVVCYSDNAALGILTELQRRGKQVPKDIAIVGFDNLLVGEQFPVQLTTVNYPAMAMAKAALRLLRDRLGDSQRGPVKAVLPAELIVRTSTAS